MQAFHRSVNRIVDCFARSESRNRWLKIGLRNELYVRKCDYGYHNREFDTVLAVLAFTSRCKLQLLNLGNIHIDVQSQRDGRFKAILSSLEEVAQKYRYDGVLIEGLDPSFDLPITMADYRRAPSGAFLKLVN